MSTFDEILKSAVNNVANNNSYQNNVYNKEEWAKNKREQREWAYKTQDDMAKKVAENSEVLRKYLNIQTIFESKSVGNAMLITAQNPKATELRDAKGWKENNIYLKRNPKKIIILEPVEYIREDGETGKTYNPVELIDISETQAKRLTNDISYKLEEILPSILSLARVKVETLPDGESNIDEKVVSFNQETKTIQIDSTADPSDIIKGLVCEIASIEMNTLSKTPIDNFKNNCVTYLICNKYGMSVQDIDLSIPEELKQMEAQNIKEVFGQAVECFQRLKVGIDRTMDRNENTRSNRDYER